MTTFTDATLRRCSEIETLECIEILRKPGATPRQCIQAAFRLRALVELMNARVEQLEESNRLAHQLTTMATP